VDEAMAAFVQSGVSVVASSCDGEGRMGIVRAVGCRVSPDRRRVTVLVPAPHPFLEIVQRSHRIAVAFARPSTHHAIQLKGEDAGIARRRKDDPELSERYVRDFVAEVGPLGYAEELIQALTWTDPETLTAVSFHPTAAFLQTPGPRAGTCLTA
jgi:hypothetical protein